ncbi:MAG: MBL fold metallo-hydrolase [Kiritimatiellae bacterium]|nr:MBL fold metallo-hydrolase [Kiritimatiellia bacterium]
MAIEFHTFPVGPYCANCTVARRGGEALVIDPGADGDGIADWLDGRGLSLSAVFLTHGHFDHISGVDALVARHPAPVLLHAADKALAFSAFNRAQPGYGGMTPTPLLDVSPDEGYLPLGWPEARVLHAPGHSPGSCCLYFPGEATLVAGDAIFAGGSYGRTDLPGGSWREMIESLRRLAALPDATRVICGHGPETAIGEWRGWLDV